MEEKTNNRQQSSQHKRNSKTPTSNKNIPTSHNSIFLATAKKQSILRPPQKILKRIGQVQRVKAFEAVVEEVGQQNVEQNKQNRYSQHSSTNMKSKHQKRIGKKTLIAAFIQVVTQEDTHKIQQQQKKRKESKKQVQPIIRINNMIYEKSQSPPLDSSLAQKQQVTQQIQNSDIIDAHILSQNNSEQMGFIHTHSDSDCIDDSSYNVNADMHFNINIKRAESEAESYENNNQSNIKMREQRNTSVSIVEKSEQVIRSMIKTDSDQLATHSDIVQGQLNKLINQSLKASEIETDSKIQDLLDEIQKNYEKNVNKIQLKRNSSQSTNFLSVPKKQRQSLNKQVTIKKQKQKTQSFSISSKKLGDIGFETQINQATKSEEQKIMELIQEKQKTKRIVKEQNLIPQRRQSKSLIRVQRRNSNGKKISGKFNEKKSIQTQPDANKLSNSIIQAQRYKSSDNKTSSHSKSRNMLSSDTQKKQLKSLHTHERISQIPSLHHSNQSIQKMTQSQIQLKKIKTPLLPNNSKSIHEPSSSIKNESILRKQSIATRYKNRDSQIPSTSSQNQSQRQSQNQNQSLKKRNNRDLEINKCLEQARKIVQNDD